MYCLLVTGVPAAGKSTIAEYLARELNIPMLSKDSIKELLFDDLGFHSREEKVRLGVASMHILYDMAERLMERNQPFILENNFENTSREGLFHILEKHGYTAVTVTLTGDYRVIHERFVARDRSPSRHRGHVVNDCYPETEPGREAPAISYEDFEAKIRTRGMDTFTANGPQIIVDTTDFAKVDLEAILREIVARRDEILEK